MAKRATGPKVKRVKTSIVMDPDVLQRLKHEAVDRHTDLSTLLESYAKRCLPSLPHRKLLERMIERKS